MLLNLECNTEEETLNGKLSISYKKLIIQSFTLSLLDHRNDEFNNLRPERIFMMHTLKGAVSGPGREKLGKEPEKVNYLTGIRNMRTTVYSLRSLSAVHGCLHLSS